MSVEFVGPFERWSVVHNGWEVPFLEATPENGGQVSLTLDRRYGLDMTVAEAERFVPFLAQAIAIASGYASHPSSEDQSFDMLRPNQPRRMKNFDLDDVSGL